jgi:hypothetical protein
MAARAAKIRGGKVEIRKEHIEIYKVTHFQNSRKTFQVKLPNDCTIGCNYETIDLTKKRKEQKL